MSDLHELLPDQLFDLLASKPFGELSESEKEMVSHHMNADEYNQYAQSVISFTTTNDAIEINKPGLPPIEVKPSKIKRLWQYKLPLYQAAAASVIFIMATIAVLQFSNAHPTMGTSQPIPTFTPQTITLDEQAITNHLAEIKLTVSKENSTVGISLANDNYPKDLVFEF